MNKKVFIMPLTVVALGISSCNNNKIKRVEFKEKTYAEVLPIHTSIKEKQQTTFLNKGTTTIKYSIKAKGKARLEDMTFHNLDLNASAGYVLSWSVDDKYFKLEGEDETIYYKWLENLGWWRYENYTSNNKRFKYKIPQEQEITSIDDFKDLIIENINDYSSITVPLAFTVGFGLTGSIYDESKTNALLSFVPDDLFDKEFNEFYETLKETYKKENEGYSVALKYGSNDENTVCSSLKGKIKAIDWHGGDRYMGGSFDIDIFSSYKDTYISQSEFILSGNVGNYRMNNFNCDLNIYLSEEVEQNKCSIDTINPDDYDLDKK